MTDIDPMQDSPFDSEFRAAHRALRLLAGPGTMTGNSDALLPVIVDELEDLVRFARDTAALTLGPTHHWSAPSTDVARWSPVILQLDFDTYSNDDPLESSHTVVWEDSAMALASRAYRRECGWDHSPDEAGIWLLSVAPFRSMGAGTRMHWTGTLNGFVILHDRDHDGQYESLAHLWTAQTWRRGGVGAGLIRAVRERFPVSHVEGPVTPAGHLLLQTCAPDLLDQAP